MENLNEQIDSGFRSQIDFELCRELEYRLDRYLKIKLHNKSEILNQLDWEFYWQLNSELKTQMKIWKI
jgi:hypothetical protein